MRTLRRWIDTSLCLAAIVPVACARPPEPADVADVADVAPPLDSAPTPARPSGVVSIAASQRAGRYVVDAEASFAEDDGVPPGCTTRASATCAVRVCGAEAAPRDGGAVVVRPSAGEIFVSLPAPAPPPDPDAGATAMPLILVPSIDGHYERITTFLASLPATIAARANGGAVPAFDAEVAVPRVTVVAPPASSVPVPLDRASDLVVSWSGATGEVVASVLQAPSGGTGSVAIECTFAAGAGTGTIPADALAALRPAAPAALRIAARTRRILDAGAYRVAVEARWNDREATLDVR
jgi:hypothetical protein